MQTQIEIEKKFLVHKELVESLIQERKIRPIIIHQGLSTVAYKSTEIYS